MDPQQRDSYQYKTASQRQSLWQILLHQYLFFRIPLWRPDAFLNRAWPFLGRFGPGVLRYGIPLTLGLGIFLVSRDWQRFLATFPHLFSLGGALAFGVALFFAKLCHEFGHAFMAKRAGCRVQSMGVAFMVLLPMFYTDVSDAWRVNDRRARLLIGAGGVLAELLLACIALLAWSLLPDGPARTAAFMLASATWITTLIINLNPFMRFDGYFLLSDLWAVDNLRAVRLPCVAGACAKPCSVMALLPRNPGHRKCAGACWCGAMVPGCGVRRCSSVLPWRSITCSSRCWASS